MIARRSVEETGVNDFSVSERGGGGGAGEVSHIKSSSITRCALFVRQRLLLLQSRSRPAGNRPETTSGGEAEERQARKVSTSAGSDPPLNAGSLGAQQSDQHCCTRPEGSAFRSPPHTGPALPPTSPALGPLRCPAPSQHASPQACP